MSWVRPTSQSESNFRLLEWNWMTDQVSGKRLQGNQNKRLYRPLSKRLKEDEKESPVLLSALMKARHCGKPLLGRGPDSSKTALTWIGSVLCPPTQGRSTAQTRLGRQRRSSHNWRCARKSPERKLYTLYNSLIQVPCKPSVGMKLTVTRSSPESKLHRVAWLSVKELILAHKLRSTVRSPWRWIKSPTVRSWVLARDSGVTSAVVRPCMKSS